MKIELDYEETWRVTSKPQDDGNILLEVCRWKDFYWHISLKTKWITPPNFIERFLKITFEQKVKKAMDNYSKLVKELNEKSLKAKKIEAEMSE